MCNHVCQQCIACDVEGNTETLKKKMSHQLVITCHGTVCIIENMHKNLSPRKSSPEISPPTKRVCNFRFLSVYVSLSSAFSLTLYVYLSLSLLLALAFFVSFSLSASHNLLMGVIYISLLCDVFPVTSHHEGF